MRKCASAFALLYIEAKRAHRGHFSARRLDFLEKNCEYCNIKYTNKTEPEKR